MSTELFLGINDLPSTISTEEYNKLLIEAKNGDDEAKNEFLKNNIKLILSRTSKYYCANVSDKKELVAAGAMGLVKALEKFDLSRSLQFSTYAVWCIDNEISKYLLADGKYKQNETLDGENFNNNVSLDGNRYSNNSDSVYNLMSIIPSEENLEKDYEDVFVKQRMMELVDLLPELDQEVIKLSFGFYDDKVYLQREIADKLNMSRSNVSMILNKDLKWLASVLKKESLIELKKERNEEIDKFYVTHIGTIRNNAVTIYDFFEKYGYSKNEVDDVLSKLNPKDLELVRKRYGNDLDDPECPGRGILNSKESNRYYNFVVPKMKKLLQNK